MQTRDLNNTKPAVQPNRVALYLTIGLAVVFSLLFVAEFFIASQGTAPDAPPATLSAQTYRSTVEGLLAGADPVHGEQLVQETYECYVCHIQGAGQQAPAFDGVALRAAETRPPLVAEAYLYESIVYPQVHIAGEDGEYSGAMPANYGTRLSPEELGDILAYLLTQTQSPESTDSG